MQLLRSPQSCRHVAAFKIPLNLPHGIQQITPNRFISARWHTYKTPRVVLLRSTGTSDTINSGLSTTPSPLADPPSPGDLLTMQLSTGQVLYLEVTKCRPSKDATTFPIEALCEGEVLRLHNDGTQVKHVGYWPRLSDAWVKSYPTLQAALKKSRQQQESTGTLPSALLNQEPSPAAPLHLTSLPELERQVADNPSYWCDGTAPEDPEPTQQQTALLSAGELIAFLQGLRGVSLVQLDLAIDPGSRAPFPLLRPFVLKLLQRAIEAKGAVTLPSIAPGGAATSLVLAAKQQPFKAWGGRLAEIGVQAALVADSPYYKLLIGKILGYKERNIVHHIESKGQKLDAKVAAAVEEELNSLSGAPPRLPWTSGRK